MAIKDLQKVEWKHPVFKRFMVFECGEPNNGGENDCQRSFDTLEEAIEYGKDRTADSVEAFDCDKRTIVWERVWEDREAKA